MSNDDKIAELDKRLKVRLVYVDTIDEKNSVKTDKVKLKKLAKHIRKNLEDSPVEAAAYSNAGR